MKADSAVNTAYKTWKEATDKEAALNTLITETELFITKVCQARLPEAEVVDAVSYALFKAVSKLPTFQEKAQYSTWVFRIANMAAAAALRRVARHAETGFEDIPVMQDLPLRLDLIALLDTLKDDEHLLLRLVSQGESLNTVSEELGISVAAAQKRWSRLKERLRNALEPSKNQMD